jgi:hypothetical protein
MELNNTIFTKAKLGGKRRGIDDTLFIQCEINNSDFTNQDLTLITFSNCNLKGSKFLNIPFSKTGNLLDALNTSVNLINNLNNASFTEEISKNPLAKKLICNSEWALKNNINIFPKGFEKAKETALNFIAACDPDHKDSPISGLPKDIRGVIFHKIFPQSHIDALKRERENNEISISRK